MNSIQSAAEISDASPMAYSTGSPSAPASGVNANATAFGSKSDTNQVMGQYSGQQPDVQPARRPSRSQRQAAQAAQAAESNLDRAFAHCRQVTKSRARNFYYGLRLTPEPKRSAIYAIYSWMRDGDDRVDSAPSPVHAAVELARFAELTRLALASAAHSAPQGTPDDLSALAPELTGAFWPAFSHTVARYGIERSIIDAMLAGLAEDLNPAPYPNDASLARYCYSVASTAGLCCLRIWGLREPLGTNPGTREAADVKAIARGKAFQLTNILRDIAEDFDATPTRCYIPTDALARHRLTPAELRSWSKPASAMGLLDEYIEKARAYYAASAGLEDFVEPECAPSLWGMTRIYSGLLDLIAADPARIVRGPRVRLSTAAKASIALTAFVRSKSNHWPTAADPTSPPAPASPAAQSATGLSPVHSAHSNGHSPPAAQ